MRRLLMFVVLMSMPFAVSGVTESSKSAVQEEASGQTAQGYLALELLTPTEGIDLNGYLRNVYRTTNKRWFANMPESVGKGQKGVNVVEFRILQDGTVPKEYVKTKRGSGKADLDEASPAAIRGAAPFGKLPAEFSAPYIELRLTFYYNLVPQQR
jgi:TonB family protein